MKLSTHLNFDGSCEQAFRFYERCFRGRIVTMRTYADSPMASQVPPQWQSKILHATLIMGEDTLMGADVLPEQYQKPQGFQVVISLSDPVEAERLFQVLAENGKVVIPMQQTFWATGYGSLMDQFGLLWEINCATP